MPDNVSLFFAATDCAIQPAEMIHRGIIKKIIKKKIKKIKHSGGCLIDVALT
jgi:hypothetical protein